MIRHEDKHKYFDLNEINEQSKNVIVLNGKEFKTRTFLVNSPETGEMQITIADETLNEEIEGLNNVKAESVDSMIYYYVESGILELSAEEICEKHLDIQFKLLEVRDSL
jgi:hypothetical protein